MQGLTPPQPKVQLSLMAKRAELAGQIRHDWFPAPSIVGLGSCTNHPVSPTDIRKQTSSEP